MSFNTSFRCICVVYVPQVYVLKYIIPPHVCHVGAVGLYASIHHSAACLSCRCRRFVCFNTLFRCSFVGQVVYIAGRLNAVSSSVLVTYVNSQPTSGHRVWLATYSDFSLRSSTIEGLAIVMDMDASVKSLHGTMTRSDATKFTLVGMMTASIRMFDALYHLQLPALHDAPVLVDQ